jgi:hypothetical protein
MHHLPSNILADSEDAVIKLIIFAIVFAIWGISALTTAVSKAAKKQMAQQRKPPQVFASRPTPPPLPVGRRSAGAMAQEFRNMTIRPAAQPVRPEAKRPAQSRPLQTPPSPPPLQRAAAQPQTTAQPAAGTPPMAHRPARSSFAGLNARSIRRQFILAEILQAPLALRDERKI